jgi:hypothetical protein
MLNHILYLKIIEKSNSKKKILFILPAYLSADKIGGLIKCDGVLIASKKNNLSSNF